MPDFLFGPTPFAEAVDFIKSKPVVARAVFDHLLPELRARAFLITGIESANVLQSVRDRIADLPAGADWNDVKGDIVDDISPFIVDPNADPETRDGQVNAANRRAELLLRTHGFQAYQSAAYAVMDRQRDALPFWQYLTMEDESVRPEHAALDHIVLPQDHPFWQTHFPPWDFGCRCQVVPISREDRDEIAEADKKRPSDDRLVLEGPLADRLGHGQITRQGRSFDVRPPREKEGSSGFHWHPSDLRIPLDQLKARYDAPVFNEFEAWARATPLGAGQPTVWQWLGGTESQSSVVRGVVDSTVILPKETKLLDALESIDSPTPTAFFLNRSTGESVHIDPFYQNRITPGIRAQKNAIGADTVIYQDIFGPRADQLSRYASLGFKHVRVLFDSGEVAVIDDVATVKGQISAKITRALTAAGGTRDAAKYVEALNKAGLRAHLDTSIRDSRSARLAARRAALPQLDVQVSKLGALPVQARKPVGWLGSGQARNVDDFKASSIAVSDDQTVQFYNQHFNLTPDQFRQALTKGLNLPDSALIHLRGGPDVFVISMDALTKDGTRIEMQRTIDFKSNQVTHNVFTLSEKSQGNDLGKTFLRNLTALYDHWGIEKVETHANIDVGGYAWIRYGFLPSTREALKRLQGQAQHSWAKLLVNHGFSPESEELVKTLLDSDDPMSIRQLADFKIPVDSTTLGKKLFLGTNWYGKIDLANPAEYSHFTKYIGYH